MNPPEMEVIELGVSSPAVDPTFTDQLEDEIAHERRNLEGLADRVSALIALRGAAEERSIALGRQCTVDDLLETKSEIKRAEVAALIARITREEQ